MKRAKFLRSLWREGRVRVPANLIDGPDGCLIPPDEQDSLQQTLRECAVEDALSFTHAPPAVESSSALWASEMLFRACTAVMHCEFHAEELSSGFQAPCPAPPSASVCYSVDLAFRFLGDLERIARIFSPKDPILPFVQNWAREWPLSSVGMPDVPNVSVDSFWEHDALRELYVRRIIQSQDESRLNDDRVRAAVLSELGLESPFVQQTSA